MRPDGGRIGVLEKIASAPDGSACMDGTIFDGSQIGDEIHHLSVFGPKGEPIASPPMPDWLYGSMEAFDGSKIYFLDTFSQTADGTVLGEIECMDLRGKVLWRCSTKGLPDNLDVTMDGKFGAAIKKGAVDFYEFVPKA
jgi:hypothetical protein